MKKKKLKDKRLDEMTDEEFLLYVNAVKYSRFEKWATEEMSQDERYKRLPEEVERQTKNKRGSLMNCMIVAYMAGMDAGVEMLHDLEELAPGKREAEPDRRAG